MRKILLGLSLVVLTAGVSTATNIYVGPAAAPDYFGSPSYTGWVDNAIVALLTGSPAAGSPLSPDYYLQSTSFQANQMIVTDFNSWNGSASPTGAFAGEYGSAITFATIINNPGSKLDITQGVTVAVDPFGTPLSDTENPGIGPVQKTAFDAFVLGVDWPGVGLPTIYATGTEPAIGVDYIFVFPGVAFETTHADSISLGFTDQENLDDFSSLIASDPLINPIHYCVSYDDPSNSASTCADAYIVPEPSSISLFGTGGLALGFALWRRRRRAA